MELSTHLHITNRGVLVWESATGGKTHEIIGITTILDGSILLFKLKH